MSLLTFEEGTRCKEEYVQKNEDEKMSEFVETENFGKEDDILKNKKMFCSGSEEDSDLEESKNASSEAKKFCKEVMIKSEKMFCSSSEENSDSEKTKNEPSERKENNIKEERLEKTARLFRFSSESDSDLEETKNASSEKNKMDIEAVTDRSKELFFSDSEEDSDFGDTKDAPSKPEKIDKKEEIESDAEMLCSENEKDSELKEMKTGVYKVECYDKEDVELKKCSVLLDDIGSNQYSNSNNTIFQEKFIKLQTFEDNKKKEVRYSSSDECQEESIKSENNSNESLDFKSEIKKLSKLKSKKRAKCDDSANFVPHKKKKEESSVFVKSNSDDDVEVVKEKEEEEEEEEDYMKTVDKSLFPLFLLEESAERRKKERRMRKAREKLESYERNITHLRTRKQVKYYESPSESEEDVLEKEKSSADSENDDMDSDFDPEVSEENSSQSEDKESQRKVESLQKNKENENMTDYEKMLEDKRNKNLELLKSIGLLEAKSDFLEAVSHRKPARVKKTVRLMEPAIKRVSERRKIHVNYTDKDTSLGSLCQKYNPTSIPFKTALHENNFYKNFVKDFSGILDENKDCIQNEPLLYDKNVLQKLSFDFGISKNRCLVLSWYPSSEDLMLAVAGGSDGSLCLWNVDKSDFKWYKFCVHRKGVTTIQFNPSVPSHLISSSRDGTLVLGDMKKQMFTKIIDISAEILNFDFFSPQTYLVSLRSGEIVIVDGRTQNEGRHKRHACHESEINTVNTHPMMKSYFVTAGKDRNVSIWDLRKLSHKPVIQITSHSKEVNSAFFSPVAGKSLLTTSLDGTIRIFDCSSRTLKDLSTPKIFKFEYPNYKGKKKALWLPNSDDTFSFNQEMIEVYDKDLNIYQTVQDGILSYRNSYLFHPYQKILISTTENKIFVSI